MTSWAGGNSRALSIGKGPTLQTLLHYEPDGGAAEDFLPTTDVALPGFCLPKLYVERCRWLSAGCIQCFIFSRAQAAPIVPVDFRRPHATVGFLKLHQGPKVMGCTPHQLRS